MHLFLAGLRGTLDMMTCAGLVRTCAVALGSSLQTGQFISVKFPFHPVSEIFRACRVCRVIANSWQVMMTIAFLVLT